MSGLEAEVAQLTDQNSALSDMVSILQVGFHCLPLVCFTGFLLSFVAKVLPFTRIFTAFLR